MINDDSLFAFFDRTFKPADHFIELADGRSRNDFAKGKMDARVTVFDTQGVSCNITLQGLFYTPEKGNLYFYQLSPTTVSI